MYNLDFNIQYAVSSQYSDFSQIGEGNEDFGIGEYNKTVTTGSYAIPFWADGRKNNGDINIYMALVPLDGNTYSGNNFVSQISDNLNLKSVSPNPSNGNINLDFEVKQNSNLFFYVFDANGKLVFKNNLGQYQQGNFNKNINLESLSSGVYFIKLQNDEDGVFVSKKLIIER
ncbi:MAG: T9SS type A sorting domain-containing protein [Saprospiraceae bacterium]